MKNEKLLRAIGDIDDHFIEEADVQAAANTGARKRRRGFAAIAASIAVIVIAGILAVNGNFRLAGRSGDTAEHGEITSNASAAEPSSSDRNAYAVNTSDNKGSAPEYDASPKGDTSLDNNSVTDEIQTQADPEGNMIDLETESYAIAPEDFSFTLVWGCYGISSYDSRTGKLVKTSDTDHIEDYTTTYYLSRKEIDEIYTLIEEMKPETYPDSYDPIKVASEPSRNIVLSVTCNGSTKTIECMDIGLGVEAADEKGAMFMAVHDRIVQILTSTDEWEALPEYEHFYQ